MFDGQPLPIIIASIALISPLYWIVPVVKLAWFDPQKFKETLSERAINLPLNVYNPKYNWNNIIWTWRVFGLVIILVSLTTEIGLLLDLIRSLL